MAEGLITPDELRRIADEKEMAQLSEADEERHHLHNAFMAQETSPDVLSGYL